MLTVMNASIVKKSIGVLKPLRGLTGPCTCLPRRAFSTFRPLTAIKPFLLSDPGEGIKEVQIIQWFVQPGARVAEFDRICEIASDKAVTEITSRYEGVIKELHHEADDFVQVGQALLDIDVEEADREAVGDLSKTTAKTAKSMVAENVIKSDADCSAGDRAVVDRREGSEEHEQPFLATPAVRGLIKQHGLQTKNIEGTGKDGRILKEDVEKFLQERESSLKNQQQPPQSYPDARAEHGEQIETPVRLTRVQSQMFKAMTRSLKIPHFLYTDEVDLTSLSTLRHKLNTKISSDYPRLTTLPFIIKALAITLSEFPLLNARFDTGSSSTEPLLHLRSQSNISVAIDTPSGLLVPNIKDVASLSINAISTEISRLQEAGRDGQITATDLSGGTITVSNIGSIGGMYVSPLIVEGQVAIVGIGREKEVPRFDEEGRVARKRMCAFSWGADHRVLDGAYVARAAERLRMLLEEPGEMLRGMR